MIFYDHNLWARELFKSEQAKENGAEIYVNKVTQYLSNEVEFQIKKMLKLIFLEAEFIV